MLLIKRAANIGNHRTEWAFPGGSTEAEDNTMLDTALRETEEEMGIARSRIECWGRLPRVMTGTGYEVWPFTGWLHENTELAPDSREVDDFAFVPLSYFSDPSARRHITLIRDERVRSWDAIAYEGRIIWGATARIILRAMSIFQSAMASK